MTKQRAEEIINFLNGITNRISAGDVTTLWYIYTLEINPDRYKNFKAPICTCDAHAWRNIIAETRGHCERIIASEDKPKVKNKKKGSR